MDVDWYCRCCYSTDLLEILCKPEMDIYLLICNNQGLKVDHTQISACLRCRKFLKDIQSFRTEHHGVNQITDFKLDVKPYEDKLVSRNTTDVYLSQMEIKAEFDPEHSKEILETSLGNLLVSNIVEGRKKISSSKIEKKRSTLSLEIKKEIILKYEQGMRCIDIAREYGRNTSTITTILNQKEVIKTANPSKGLSIISKKRSSLNDEMERLLLIWIKEKEMAGDAITKAIVTEKASAIYKDIMKKVEEEEGEMRFSLQDEVIPAFKASSGWFNNFRKRCGIHTVVRNGEATSFDKKTAEKFSKTFAQLVKKEGYVSQQVFNCKETALFWKKMPRRTYITAEENEKPGHKPMKDRLTLTLCANASGDCKIKPLLVYHSENPRAFKTHKILKENLQVMWRANTKAWVTRQYFVEWVNMAFGPDVKKFLEDNELPLKCLLVLDNSPAHPPRLEDNILEEFSFIKVLYLPPNTTTLLQPMDQQVIAKFKKLYTKHLFKKCFEVTQNTNLTLREFWKHFHIVACLKIIDLAWQELTRHVLTSAWRKLWPDVAVSVEVEPESDLEEVVTLGRAMGLEVNEEDINLLIEEHKEELSTEELKEMEEMAHTVAQEELNEKKEEAESISTAEIKAVLANFKEIVEFVEKKHPEKVFTNKAIAHFDDVCLTHFRNILKSRQKSSSDKLTTEETGESEGGPIKAKRKKKMIKIKF